MATFGPSTRMDPATGTAKWKAHFVSMPGAALTHPNFADLPGGACKLLLAMLSSYRGNNNGHLTATHAQMKAFGFSSKDSLARGIRELMAFGYIVRTCEHHLRAPALYALTWFPINSALAGRPYDAGIAPSDYASDLWREIDPAKTRCAA